MKSKINHSLKRSISACFLSALLILSVAACSNDNTETRLADDHSSTLSEVSEDISQDESSANDSNDKPSTPDSTKPVVVMDEGLSAAAKMSLEMKQEEELTAENCAKVTTLSVSSQETTRCGGYARIGIYHY